MRRLMYSVSFLAAFALFLAVPVWAQHGGGGHAGGGHGGGFSSGHAGFSGGGSHFSGGVSHGMSAGAVHSASGARGFSRSPNFSQRAFTRPGRSNGPFLHNDFRGPRFRTFGNGFRNNCRGFNCPFIYPYSDGYYDPYWWGDSGSSSYDQDQDYQDNVAQAAEMNRENLEEQQMFRQEQADGDQDVYARPRSTNPLAAGLGSGNAEQGGDGASIIPATVLVFRDQHKEEIRNYAIVGQTLWSFGSPRTEKIPLADLDLAATIKANNDRGVSFRVPSPNEGQ